MLWHVVVVAVRETVKGGHCYILKSNWYGVAKLTRIADALRLLMGQRLGVMIQVCRGLRT